MKIKYELLNERLMSNKKSKMYDYAVLKQFQDEQAKIWKFTKLRGGGEEIFEIRKGELMGTQEWEGR